MLLCVNSSCSRNADCFNFKKFIMLSILGHIKQPNRREYLNLALAQKYTKSEVVNGYIYDFSILTLATLVC